MDIAILQLFVQCSDGEIPVLSVSNENYALRSQILGHTKNPAGVGKHIRHPARFLNLGAFRSFLTDLSAFPVICQPNSRGISIIHTPFPPLTSCNCKCSLM